MTSQTTSRPQSPSLTESERFPTTERQKHWDRAGDPLTPLADLELYAAETDRGLRWRVATNSACPASLLTKLAVDSAWQTRMGVAANPSCPVSLVAEFLRDPDEGVRRAAAQSPALTSDVLESLVLTLDAATQQLLLARDDLAEHIKAAIALGL